MNKNLKHEWTEDDCIICFYANISVEEKAKLIGVSVADVRNRLKDAQAVRSGDKSRDVDRTTVRVVGKYDNMNLIDREKFVSELVKKRRAKPKVKRKVEVKEGQKPAVPAVKYQEIFNAMDVKLAKEDKMVTARENLKKAIIFQNEKPLSAIIHARKSVEEFVLELYQVNIEKKAEMNFYKITRELLENGVIPNPIYAWCNAIYRLGFVKSDDTKHYSPSDIRLAVEVTLRILEWYTGKQ